MVSPAEDAEPSSGPGGQRDHIAADRYNWYHCKSSDDKWRQLWQIIEAHRQFGRQHPAKGLMLWEIGSTEDFANPGRKAQWLRNARALFKQPGYSQYRAVLTWEGRLSTSQGTRTCNFDYLSSSSARDAWKAMANDSYYRAAYVH